MTSRIFPSCQQQNHEILRDGETCHACGSPPWLLFLCFKQCYSPAAAATGNARIPQYSHPQLTNPPTLGLASHLIGSGGGRRGTSQQRARARPPTLSATTSSTPQSVPFSAPPSAPPVE